MHRMIRTRGAGRPNSTRSLQNKQFVSVIFSILWLFQSILVFAIPLDVGLKSVDQTGTTTLTTGDERGIAAVGALVHGANGDIEANLQRRATTVTAIETVIKTVVNIETVTTLIGGNEGGIAATKTCTAKPSGNPNESSQAGLETSIEYTTVEVSTIESQRPSRSLNPTSTLPEDLEPTSTVTSLPTELPDEALPESGDSTSSQAVSVTVSSVSEPMVSSILIPIGFGEVESISSFSESTLTTSTISVVRVSHILSGGIISQGAIKTDNPDIPTATEEAKVYEKLVSTSTESFSVVSQTVGAKAYTGDGIKRRANLELQLGTAFAIFIALIL